ncbi:MULTISPECIES: RraA family protein [unclassified Pantoea]|uniref:RraA family protein n=1 Tax=unclassified Pantoea TaxID=2630326 RepID=UPI001CD56CFB|nr:MULTISPECIES: RraA family protein [unclassified Pantoea]MCA1177350.1 RraA family protein [Pantoea sp. alder69]MCA1249744.1 RraA family protein [Pantoea sp. alder70]MCA1265839.1 RraA family protein [Pantoea sp. alder81]
MNGFRIVERTRKASQAQIAAYDDLPVANISDAMHRMSGGGAGLRPYHAGGYMAGAALTVKSRPGDNLMVHYALNIAEPGDVIVVDAGGDLTNAIVGELMLAFAAKKHVAGVVINGAVRDTHSIGKNRLPVYAAGVTHRGPYKDGPGEVNVPISISGMVIEPGDLIVGDEDGFLCVPFAEIDRIHALAHERHLSELAKLQAIEEGRNKRDWVEKKLQLLGVI